MKKKTTIPSLIAVAAVIAVMVFTGCVEEEPVSTPTPTATSSPKTPALTPAATHLPTATATPTPTPISIYEQSEVTESTDYGGFYNSLLEVTSQDDLNSLSTNGGIPDYIQTLVDAEKKIPWAHLIPSELAHDYVLPVRFHPAYNLDTAYYYPEKIENWRVPMYEKAKEIIGSTADPYIAAKKLEEWVHVNIPYLAENQPKYLQPTLVVNRGGGSCWQQAIVLAALYRSVNLPARIVVGASYWSPEVKASGRSHGDDFDIVILEDFWISRDWERWYKDLKIHDDTSNRFLSNNEYTVTIKTITQAGKQQLIIEIPSHVALDHKFSVTLKFAAPQGHEWVEVYIPGKGWIDADGSKGQFDQGLNFPLGQFDQQAYNSATGTWESTYFFYKYSQPIECLLGFCEDIIAKKETEGIEVPEAKIRFDQAKAIYRSVTQEELDASGRQERGQQIYQLLGEAITLCNSGDKHCAFFNIWNVTKRSPKDIASELNNEHIKSIGVLLPYNVFDLAEIKKLYAWRGYGSKPPYVNEVKREYFWLEDFRSSLATDTKLYVIIVGYDPIDGQWKTTLTEFE